ncbi:MAG TPA: PilX N-terminal domain-containing pilus assembly protein [Gammaproteobacteria bacterium]|nr:PilX N-terminal domain-containing pilus assembly protein [Gammaproteobacteria bacterium]
MTHRNPKPPRSQRGVALVIGLIVLLLLTMIGIAAMSSSVLGLAMANNTQATDRTFQAAQSAQQDAISSVSNFNTMTSTNGSLSLDNTNANWTNSYQDVSKGGCQASDKGGTSISSGSGLASYRFQIQTDAKGPRHANSHQYLGVCLTGRS